MTENKQSGPVYTGMKNHVEEAGFSMWVPSDWRQYKLEEGRQGVLYSPYADDFNTAIFLEKRKLKVHVDESDLPTLREGFIAGIKALPGVEIEMQDEFLTKTLSFFEARFTYLEGDVRRKRWIRNIYWGKNNYILIAQGRTPEDFDHWLPMFYNTMMNTTV